MRLMMFGIAMILLLTGCALPTAADGPGDNPSSVPSATPTVDAQIRERIADWPTAHVALMTPPQPPALMGTDGLADVVDTSQQLMFHGHINPRTLAGSADPFRRISYDLGYDLWEEPGLDVLLWTTRFGDGWTVVGQPRVKGAWDETVQQGSRIVATWRGTFAYELERDGVQRIVLLSREFTMSAPTHSANPAPRNLEVALSAHGLDFCRSHGQSGWVPDPEPFESVPDVLDHPERPDLDDTPSVEEFLAEEGCVDVVPAPLPS
jgi:hypothetical protein